MRSSAAEGPLATYARAVRGRAWLVATVAVLTLGASIAWLQVRSPTYKATAEVVVTPLPQDDPALLGIQPLPDPFETTRTLQTAAGLLRSSDAARATARRLGGGHTTRSVLEAVRVEPRGESSLLAITGSAESPEAAARLANVFTASVLGIRGRAFQSSLEKRLRSLRRQRDDLLQRARRSPDGPALRSSAVEISERINRLHELRGIGDPTLKQSARAQLPTQPSGAPSWVIIALASVFGLALGSGAALLSSAVDRRITEEEEILSIYPLPVFARIAEGDDASHVPQNREAFRTLAAQLSSPVVVSAASGSGASAAGRERGSLLLISSASSGDGKTTCATALARAIAAAGNQVILIDLDLRRPSCAAALGVDVPAKRTLLHAKSLANALVDVPDVPGLRLIVGGVARDEAELVTLSRSAAGLVKAARVHPAFVVVDTAPIGQVGDALYVAPSADEILLVARLGNTERDALGRVRDLLEQSGLEATGLLLVEPAVAGHVRRYAYALNSERGPSS